MLEELIQRLLDPYTGVERGLLAEDAHDKLINIRVSELREIAFVLRLMKARIEEENDSAQP